MCLISHLLNLDINNMDQKTHWFQLNGNYSFNLIKFFFSFGEQSILWKDMSRCHLIVILNGFYSIVLLLPSVAKIFENNLPMLRVSLIAIHSIFYFCKKNLLVWSIHYTGWRILVFLVIFRILVEQRSHGTVCKSFGLRFFCLISNFLPKKAIV